MRGSRDDEQLLVGRIRIGLANHVVALSLAFHHVFVGSLTKVARVSLLSMHHEDGRADLVDVIEETAIGVSLCTDGTPTVV